MIHPRRSLLMRALDGMNPVEADLSMREARDGDRYMLCTDGLSGVVEPTRRSPAILADGDPTGCVTRLVDLALERGAPDNVTVVDRRRRRRPRRRPRTCPSSTRRSRPSWSGAAGEPRVRLRLPGVRFPDDAQPDPDRPDAPPPVDGGPPTAPQPLIDAEIVVPAAETARRAGAGRGGERRPPTTVAASPLAGGRRRASSPSSRSCGSRRSSSRALAQRRSGTSAVNGSAGTGTVGRLPGRPGLPARHAAVEPVVGLRAAGRHAAVLRPGAREQGHPRGRRGRRPAHRRRTAEPGRRVPDARAAGRLPGDDAVSIPPTPWPPVDAPPRKQPSRRNLELVLLVFAWGLGRARHAPGRLGHRRGRRQPAVDHRGRRRRPRARHAPRRALEGARTPTRSCCRSRRCSPISAWS